MSINRVAGIKASATWVYTGSGPQSMEDIYADNEEIASALLSRALQHVFCRQFDAAVDDLNLWPEANRAKMKAGFAVSIKQDYPQFAGRLAQTPKYSDWWLVRPRFKRAKRLES